MDFESEFDYYQEVARSGFGDMLHDHERNRKYFLGLEKAIKSFRSRNLPVHVLDIGTGSGLLSLMAVKLGADSVTACEAFRPMADCAEKIFEVNGVRDKVQLIKLRSTEIVVGEQMKQRANILVTEVFDTELIGEGAIEIFNHAHECLLEKECIVVPHFARIYVQLVESPLLDAFNKPKSIADLDGEVLIRTPKKFLNCPGTTSLFDVQLSQFPVDRFKTICKPFHLMSFDFSGKEKIEKYRTIIKQLKAEANGYVQGIFFWWDLQMDLDDEIVISCAPFWSHPDFQSKRKEVDLKIPDSNVIPWRDHWMQAIYFAPSYIQVSQGDEIFLNSNHGQYSWWFSLSKIEIEANNKVSEPFCNCGLHHFCSRLRIGQMNQSLRTKEYVKYYESAINESSVVLAISNGSLICLGAAGFGPKSLFYFDSSFVGREILKDYNEHNEFESVKIVSNLSDDSITFTELTNIIGEPHFAKDLLPWSSIDFFNAIRKIKDKLPENISIFPSSVKLFLIPVEFLDLHKIKSPMKNIESFNVGPLDELLEKAYQIADDKFEAHSLWEYPCRALSEELQIHSISLKEYLETNETESFMELQKSVKIQSSGNMNGIVIWTVWNDKKYLTTGPTDAPVPGELIKWDMFSKQGVYLIPQPKDVQVDNEITLNFKMNFSKLFLDCSLEYQ